MKEVSILIPTRFNNRWVLELNLKTIRKYTRYPYRIVIGDAGMDDEVADFLGDQSDVEVVKCPDPLSPKNHLARIADTPYFLFLHDDAQVLRHGWMKRRIDILERKTDIGIVGPILYNLKQNLGWRKHITFSPLTRRFFPFALLVRKQVQDEINLFWGKHQEFDTGSIAYLQFLRYNMRKDLRRKWTFVHYPGQKDIKHWRRMTWPIRQKILGHKSPHIDIDRLIKERNEKIDIIRKILKEKSY